MVKAPACPICGYSLEGLESNGTCPECGTRHAGESSVFRAGLGPGWGVLVQVTAFNALLALFLFRNEGAWARNTICFNLVLLLGAIWCWVRSRKSRLVVSRDGIMLVRNGVVRKQIQRQAIKGVQISNILSRLVHVSSATESQTRTLTRILLPSGKSAREFVQVANERLQLPRM
jgi:hypothetical protein